jgi:2,3-bisphosphoglycerate-dependent phosphoglycerate mutase
MDLQAVDVSLGEQQNVLVAAHGNSLSSIIMELENISEEDIPKLELGTAIPIIYEINSLGHPLKITKEQ